MQSASEAYVSLQLTNFPTLVMKIGVSRTTGMNPKASWEY